MAAILSKLVDDSKTGQIGRTIQKPELNLSCIQMVLDIHQCPVLGSPLQCVTQGKVKKLPLLLPPCIIAASASRSIPGKEFEVRDKDDLAEFGSVPPPPAAFKLKPEIILLHDYFTTGMCYNHEEQSIIWRSINQILDLTCSACIQLPDTQLT
jgi:hypothetical protein